MRGLGDFQDNRDLARAALVMDLHAAGVHFEMGDEAGAFKEIADMRPVVQPAEVKTVEALAPRMVKTAEAPVEVKAARVEPVGMAWAQGEPGGVVVVLQGAKEPVGKTREILERMLSAVAMDKGMALGWVGVAGKVTREVLVAKIEEMKPARVLVLGQGVLGILAGKLMGVEGWQAAPCALPGCAGVGVTYPPELLLAQPLFKRLAWQHLLAWKMATEGQA